MDGSARLYRARGGEVAWIGPCGYDNVTLYGFVVGADGARVHEMFSRYIGAPSLELGAHIDVAGTTLDRVLCLCIDSNRRQLPPDGVLGSPGAYSEQLFAVVALGYRRSPNPGLVLFAPYLYGSDTPGWKADREIYGYPLQQGRVKIDVDGAARPYSLSVSARVIKKFAPDARAEPEMFLHIVRDGSSASGQPGPGGQTARTAALLNALTVEPRGRRARGVEPPPRLGVTEADLAFFEHYTRGSAQQASDGGSIEHLSVLDTLKSFPMLFLKQFRDILYPDRACYQAIVEAPIEICGAVVPIGENYRLELEDYDSAPIARELGIPTGGVEVDFAFRVDVERMSVGAGTVISNPDWNPAVEVSTPDEPPRLPRYVERGGEAVWRQPSLLHGARIYGFGVEVPSRHQQLTLDSFVNEVAAESQSLYGCRPFCLRPCDGVEMVMLLFVEYDRISSGNEHDKRLGGDTYCEFLATQLAISDDPLWPELDWFISYIALDVDAPRLGGREIYGYPKQLGTIRLVRYDGFDPARQLTLEATVIRDRASHSAERDVTVVSITGPDTPPDSQSYSSPQQMFLDLWRSWHAGGTVNTSPDRIFPFLGPGVVVRGANRPVGPGVDLVSALLNTGIGDVFLKEFRDSQDPERACYQAVCKTDTIPAKFHGGGRLLNPFDYRIAIADLPSEPLLRSVLGMDPAYHGTITPKFAYWLDLDLELTAGRVIANPLAADYAPDVSPRRTRLPGRQQPRKRRMTRFAEPFWAR